VKKFISRSYEFPDRKTIKNWMKMQDFAQQGLPHAPLACNTPFPKTT